MTTITALTCAWLGLWCPPVIQPSTEPVQIMERGVGNTQSWNIYDVTRPPSLYTGFVFEGKAEDVSDPAAKFTELKNGFWCDGRLPKVGDRIEWVVQSVEEKPTSYKITGCYQAVTAKLGVQGELSSPEMGADITMYSIPSHDTKGWPVVGREYSYTARTLDPNHLPCLMPTSTSTEGWAYWAGEGYDGIACGPYYFDEKEKLQ